MALVSAAHQPVKRHCVPGTDGDPHEHGILDLSASAAWDHHPSYTHILPDACCPFTDYVIDIYAKRYIEFRILSPNIILQVTSIIYQSSVKRLLLI